jgi:hypothetical protein
MPHMPETEEETRCRHQGGEQVGGGATGREPGSTLGKRRERALGPALTLSSCGFSM